MTEPRWACHTESRMKPEEVKHDIAYRKQFAPKPTEPVTEESSMNLDGLDPEPQDGELGYTSPLEGGRDGMPDYHSDEPIPGQVPGQVTLLELLEERDPPIDTAEELGLTTLQLHIRDRRRE